MIVKFQPNDKDTPSGKLADAELIFTDAEGPLSGLKLIGFALWQRRGGGINITFPARTYNVNGERRTYALLRPLADVHAQERLRDLIVAEWDAQNEQKENLCIK